MSSDFNFSLDEDTQFTQILNTQGLVLPSLEFLWFCLFSDSGVHSEQGKSCLVILGLLVFHLGQWISFIICFKSMSKIFTFLSAIEERPMSRPFKKVEKVTTCLKAKLENQFSLHPCVHHFVLVQSSIIEWLSQKNPLWFYVLYKGAINFCMLLYILKSYPKKNG